MALSDGSLRRECLVAIGGEADIARTPPACRCEAIDPKRTFAGLKCRSALRNSNRVLSQRAVVSVIYPIDRN